MSFDEVKNEEMTGYSEQTFESIKHINEYGAEYWLARELSKVLDYKDFRNFELLIYKAMESCKNSGYEISDHFGEVTEMVRIGSKAQRELPSYMLSRYACYLTVMNGDPRKEVIAIGQTYFAIKTRQQEIIEDYEQLSEDQKRLATRKEIKHHNSALADAAHDAGIVRPLDYAVFQNYGYMGLYNGLKAGDIRLRKGLKKGQDILDYMGSTELAANLFRATQTEEKLRRDNVKGKEAANQTHLEVGRKVRQTIAELGGTMPEDLPTPQKSIKQIESEQKKLMKKKD